tara:strand:- start:434 stop:769 length:336 start_codon:yes stop_codon:yes gene_type:complete
LLVQATLQSAAEKVAQLAGEKTETLAARLGMLTDVEMVGIVVRVAIMRLSRLAKKILLQKLAAAVTHNFQMLKALKTGIARMGFALHRTTVLNHAKAMRLNYLLHLLVIPL